MPFMSLTPDARGFSTPRLYSSYGYDRCPVVDDSFQGRLPPLSQRTGRLIQVDRRIFEIWLPNSSVHPFLPGIVPPGFTFFVPPSRTLQRYDGHLGPFDYTVSPQMFRSDALWRGYILWAPTRDSILPEFQSVNQAWVSPASPKTPFEGRLDNEFIKGLALRISGLRVATKEHGRVEALKPKLWQKRPSLPSLEEVEELGKMSMYEDVVDLGKDIQRRMRDFDAWHRYVQLILTEDHVGNVETWLNEPLNLANDTWIGAWINGGQEQEVLAELRRGMPGFLAYELSEIERGDLGRSDVPYQNLMERTDASRLSPLYNEYDKVADKNNTGFTPGCPPLLAGALAYDSAASLASSSCWHGWTGRYFSEAIESRKFLLANSDQNRSRAGAPSGVVLPPLLQDLVTVEPGRLAWIRPPPVAKASGKGQWSQWVEDESANVPTMRQAGRHRRNKDDEPLRYFDRKRKRILHFGEGLVVPKGAVSDTSTFGLPAPTYEYVNYNGSQREPTLWLYETEHPRQHDIDRTAPTPCPSLLPLLTDISASDNNPYVKQGPDSDLDAETDPVAPSATKEPDVGEAVDVSMSSPRSRSKERREPWEQERSVSLGSSLPASRPVTLMEASNPIAGLSHETQRAQPTSQATEEGEGVHGSAYLKVASFPTRESWTTFLADIQTASSRNRIKLKEVLRTHREENVHMAWVLAGSGDDASWIRDHYAGQFKGRDLEIIGISESNYRDIALTAAETWSPMRPASYDRIEKCGRLQSPPRRGTYYASGSSTFQARGSHSPPRKRYRGSDRHWSPQRRSRSPQRRHWSPQRRPQSPQRYASIPRAPRNPRSTPRSPSPRPYRQPSPTPWTTPANTLFPPQLSSPQPPVSLPQPVPVIPQLDPSQLTLLAPYFQALFPALMTPTGAMLAPPIINPSPLTIATPIAPAPVTPTCAPTSTASSAIKTLAPASLQARLTDAYASPPKPQRRQRLLVNCIGDVVRIRKPSRRGKGRKTKTMKNTNIPLQEPEEGEFSEDTEQF